MNPTGRSSGGDASRPHSSFASLKDHHVHHDREIRVIVVFSYMFGLLLCSLIDRDLQSVPYR